MTQMRSPHTGAQYTITYGDYRAVITEQGATLRRLDWQDTEVIVPFDANEPAPTCHGQILVPFPNRIEAGTYTFDGNTYVLPIDEHERNTAIHGYGYRERWILESLQESAVTLSWRTPALAGYPFDVTVEAEYRLDEQGLHIAIRATNYGDRKAPWALAVHPWLANGLHGYGDEIDEHNAQCSLMIPGNTHVTVDQNLIPTGTEPVEGTKYDLRQATLLTEQPFDDAWTDLQHDDHGTVTAVFTRPDGVVVRIGGDETITSFQVCTGTHFPAPQHPAGVAVEPQTAYANAFNTGIDLITIEPGSTSTTEMFIAASRD